MKFKFKGHIGKSAFFPLPPFVIRLFVYIDCWNFYGNKHNYYYYYYYYIISGFINRKECFSQPKKECFFMVSTRESANINLS